MSIVLGNTCSGKGLLVDILGLPCPVKKHDPTNDKRSWVEILNEVTYERVLYAYRDPRVSFLLEICDIMRNKNLKEISNSEMYQEIEKFGDCSDFIDKLRNTKKVYTLKFEDYLADSEKVFYEITDFFNLDVKYTPKKHYNSYLTRYDYENNNFEEIKKMEIMLPLVTYKYIREIYKWKYKKKLSVEEILRC